MTTKKILLLIVLAGCCYALQQALLGLVDGYVPSKYAIVVNQISIMMLIFCALLIARDYGTKDGKLNGHKTGYAEGVEATRKARPSFYNDNCGNRLPDGFLYQLLWSENTDRDLIINFVKRVTGSDMEAASYYIVMCGTIRPLPKAFIMRNGEARTYAGGGGITQS